MEIWTLKTQAEPGMSKVKVGTFTAIGGHGQTKLMQLGKTEALPRPSFLNLVVQKQPIAAGGRFG
jgi:hypothetical protein